MAINSCKDCVPPKRHEACHEHCPDYNIEKIIEILQKAASVKEKKVDADITSQRFVTITKSIKRRGAIRNK